MRIIFSIMFILSITACASKREKIIHYVYNGVQVTRVDLGNRSCFYYGYCNNEDIPCFNESVTIDWSFDNYLFGFILFNNDSTVEIINGGGGEYINHKNSDTRLFVIKYKNFQMSNIESYSEGEDYDNLLQLSNNIELEIKRNNEFGSRVDAIIYNP